MDTEFRAAWSTIREGIADEVCVAATTLVVLRDQLQAAAFVQVPAGGLYNPFWRIVVKGSVPQCECGLRRLILPSRGRAIPTFADGHYTVDADHTLIIAPWGGDLASAYASFRLQGGRLIGKHHPFALVQPQYEYESWALRCTEPLRPNEQAFDLHQLAEIVRTKGGNLCMQPLGDLVVPICMVVEVSLEHECVTFRIDNTVTLVNPNEPPHVCSN